MRKVCKERRHDAGGPTGVVDQQDDLGVQQLLGDKQAADNVVRDPPGSTHTQLCKSKGAAVALPESPHREAESSACETSAHPPALRMYLRGARQCHLRTSAT